jgi:hypothetical protein
MNTDTCERDCILQTGMLPETKLMTSIVVLNEEYCVAVFAVAALFYTLSLEVFFILYIYCE